MKAHGGQLQTMTNKITPCAFMILRASHCQGTVQRPSSPQIVTFALPIHILVIEIVFNELNPLLF